MKKFIGRVKEKRVFKESVTRILDGEEQDLFPRLFLFHGQGGLGKTMLLDECIRVAKETAAEKGKGIKVIKLDWDDYYNKKSTLPDDDTKMIKGLYTVFCENVEKPETYFTSYINKLNEIEKVNKKVEEKRKDFSTEAKILTDGLKMLAGTGGVPVPDKAGEIFQKGLSSVLSYGHEQELKFREWLRERRTLPEKDITLYENANHDLSIALVNGLLALSEDCTVILAVDTYERVDNEKIEDWFRTLFLKKIMEDNPRIVTLLSGRNNHDKAYRGQFPDESMHSVLLDDILFNTDEIKDFTKAFGLDLKEEDIKKLGRHTQGIPIVVAEVCHLLQDGNPLEEVLESFTSRTEQIKDIVEGVVDRFLKHCNDETRERVFHLAMLRQFDDKLLSEIWSVPLREVNRVLSALADRHSFIQQRRMHTQVRQFIRGHLVNEIVSKRNSHVFEDFGKNILASLGTRLKELGEEYELPEDLFTDETFQTTFLAYINALLWTNRQRGFLEIRKHFMELLVFNHAILFEVFLIMNELESCLSAKQKKDYKILFQGFLENAFARNFGNVHGKGEMELLKFFDKNKRSFTDFQRQLLAYKWADLYRRIRKLDEALSMLDKAHELTTIPGKIKDEIIEIYNVLGAQYFKKNSYAKSLKCFDKAIDLNPGYAKAYANRGAVYFKQQDYDNALSNLNRAIELNPINAIAFNSRGAVYSVQKDYDSALSDFTRSIELNLEYAGAYGNRGIVYSEQEDYDNAISDYTRAIELDPEYAVAYKTRGIVYNIQKKYDSALFDLNRAIELNPELAGAYDGRGRTYTAIGEFDKSLSDYIKAIELDPGEVNAYLNLAELYIITDDFPNALETLHKALSLSLGMKNKAIVLYLETIAKKMTGADVAECERQFNQILNEDFTLTSWSFDEIESWLQRTPMPEEKKDFIKEKTEALKKHKS